LISKFFIVYCYTTKPILRKNKHAMKNINTLILVTFFSCFISFSQQEKGIKGEDNWLSNWTQFNPKIEDYGEPTKIG